MQELNQRPSSPIRYAAIDGMRFIAAMGVVLHHYAGFAGNAHIDSLFARNYLFVDFFFIISGFVIFHNYAGKTSSVAGYFDFLKNRLARVYPLHLAVLLVFIVLSFTLWRAKVDRAFVDPAAIIPNLLLIHAWGTTQSLAFNYPSWSISAEWCAYLAFPAIVWLTRRGGALAAIGAAAAIIAVLETSGFLGVLAPWTTLTHQFGALRALPTFLVGAAIAHALTSFNFRLANYAPAWIMFCASFAAMMAGLDDRLIILMLIACVLATVVAERDGASGVLTSKFMTRLGDYSYAVYMIHPLVAIACINLLGVRILQLEGTALVVWCAICAFVPNLLLAAFIFRWVETPSRRRIRRWKLPGRSRELLLPGTAPRP